MYNQVKNKLEEFLKKDDVESNLEVISLYDLQIAIESVLKEFFIVVDGSQIEEYFKNKYNNNSNWLTNLLGLKNDKHNSLGCSSWFNLNELNGDITWHLTFPKEFKGINFEAITINKKIDNEQLDFGEHHYEEKKKFIMNNLEFIMNTLAIIEEFYTTFKVGYNGIVLGSESRQKMNDGFFNITMDYSSKVPTCDISLLDEIENKFFSREYNNLPYLKGEFDKRRGDYMKKIAISVNELNPFFQKVVEKYFDSEKIKTK